MTNGSLQAKKGSFKLLISLFLLLIGYFQLLHVEGNSMLPSIKDGDSLIYKPYKFSSERQDILKEGCLIILRHPFIEKKLLVKRILKITPKGIEVRGDNEEETTDSIQYGLISYKQVIGIVNDILPKII